MAQAMLRSWKAVARVVAGTVLSLAALTAVSVPIASATAAAPTVEHVCSAPQPGQMACLAERVVDPQAIAASAAASSAQTTVLGYGPPDLRSAYNLPTGGTARIAVVAAMDQPSAESDLATYRAHFGLPPCTTANGCFSKVNQSGQVSPLPTADHAWGQEIDLDLDMVSAVCPNCRITLVEAYSATPANLGTAVNTAVARGANVVSTSYGGNESSSDPSTTNSYYNHPGVLITAASDEPGYGVSYPAAAPTVLAVGGTTLARSSSARGWSESVWGTPNGVGTGSGCSAVEQKPSWQHDTGCTHRTVNDVSAVADPKTGVAVYNASSGGWLVMGGTSAASPIVAGIYAVTGHASASPSFPYSNVGDEYDVTSGANGTCGGTYLCTARPGYDGPTGLGTPNGKAMAGGAVSGSDFSIAVSPASGTVAAGSGAAATISTTTVSGGAQTVSLSVAGGLPSGTTASLSPTSVTSGSSATLSVSTSASTPPGSYVLTVRGSAGSLNHTTTYTLTVASGSSTGQKLTNPGFESGTSGWVGSNGVIGQYTTEPARSGTKDAWLAGFGTTGTYTLSQTVTIPAGLTNYTLSFWLHVDSAETTATAQNDTLTVKLGATTLATYSNLNRGTGYTQKTFNVASSAGQTVTLTFTGTENSSLQTSFVIDDTALTVS